MYIIELSLKLSPFPLSVECKDLAKAQALYNQVRESMTKGHPTLLELSCDQIENKKLSALTSEILSVQIYEKTTLGIGAKRPGFSLDS